MGGRKNETETKPVYDKEIGAANQSLTNTYNQQAPKIAGYADEIGGTIPGLLDKYNQGDAGINAARDYNVDVLGGNYLGANPYLDDIIAQSSNDTVNASQASLGLRGLTGGSDYAGIIADRVSENSLGARYQDYDNERSRMSTAAGQAPSIAAGGEIPLNSALNAASFASGAPLNAASQFASGVGGLLGPYTNQTQTQNPGLFGWAGAGLQGVSLLSDARAKENIVRVGATDGGLPTYTYNYRGDDTRHMGVMAQDVAEMQPDALGEPMGDYMTVNYGKVR